MTTQILSLYIPRVFANITKNYMEEVFYSLHIGEVSQIDFVPRVDKHTGVSYNMAFIHFKYYFDNIASINFQKRVIDVEHEAKIVYDDPWYWSCLQNVNPKPDNIRVLEARIEELEQTMLVFSKYMDFEYMDSQHMDSQHMDSQYMDSQHMDSQHMDSQHMDSMGTDLFQSWSNYENSSYYTEPFIEQLIDYNNIGTTFVDKEINYSTDKSPTDNTLEEVVTYENSQKVTNNDKCNEPSESTSWSELLAINHLNAVVDHESKQIVNTGSIALIPGGGFIFNAAEETNTDEIVDNDKGFDTPLELPLKEGQIEQDKNGNLHRFSMSTGSPVWTQL